MRKVLFVIFLFLIFINNVSAKEKYNILTLGDSITAGYGVLEEEKYPMILYNDLIKTNEDFEFVLTEEAISGIRSIDLINYIDNNENNIKEKIKDADLIVVSIGSNDILTLLSTNLLDDCMSDFSECTNILKNLSSKMETAKNNLKVNIDDIIKKITNINDDVVIYFVAFYNPFVELEEIALLEDLIIELENYKEELNNYLISYANNDSYSIAIDKELSKVLEEEININFNYKKLNFDPHPTNLGHEEIASFVINNSKVQNSLIIEKQENTAIYILSILFSIGIILLLIIIFKTRR